MAQEGGVRVRSRAKPGCKSSVNRYQNSVCVDDWNSLCLVFDPSSGTPCRFLRGSCPQHQNIIKDPLALGFKEVLGSGNELPKSYRLVKRAVEALIEYREDIQARLSTVRAARDKARDDISGFVKMVRHGEDLGLPGPIPPVPILPSSRVLDEFLLEPLTARGEEHLPYMGSGVRPAAPTKRMAPAFPKKTEGSNVEVEAGISADPALECNGGNDGGGWGEQVAGLSETPLDEIGHEEQPSIPPSAGVAQAKSGTASAAPPPNHNQPWSVEEQKRLDELLVMYPYSEEQSELQRWDRIAAALGTRTARQVGSRTQKYFAKLVKQGLPIPGGGRVANSVKSACKKGKKRPGKGSSGAPKKSKTVISVKMEGADGGPGEGKDDEVDLPDVDPELRRTAEYHELKHLARLKKERGLGVRPEGADNGHDPLVHYGYGCDRCGMDPIIGTRWHCSSCPEEVSVDLCSNCEKKEFLRPPHGPEHILMPIQHADRPYFAGDGGFNASDNFGYGDTALYAGAKM